MSSAANFTGSFLKLECVTLAGTSETTIYTASGSNMTFKSLTLCNSTAGAIVAKAYWKYSSSSKMIWVGSIATNTTVSITEPTFPLLDGGAITVIGNTGLDCALSLVMNVASR